jgi:hypothetical protein
MCADNFIEDGGFRVRYRPPASPVCVEVRARRATTAARSTSADGVAPAYLFPPGAARCLEEVGIAELSFPVADVAEIPPLRTVLEQPDPWRASSS